MSTYICKCGRKVQKSTTADNTGNRQTEGCTGCPYLLPWGPMVYHEDVGYQMDMQGYECRMSPRLRYTSTYWGGANNKGTLRILSLDFDWMEQVDAWISEHYPNGELSGRFDRSEMRGTDFSNEGRYSWSICCAQNRKGMEAKAALIAEFFTPEKYRKDIICPGMTTTAEQAEKEIVLKQIAAGKAAAQEKETAPCADLTPTTNPTPTAAPSSTQSPVTVPTASIGETVPGGLNKETAAGRAYRSVTGMIYAVRKYSDEAFRIMCHYAGEEWMLATSPQFSAPCRCAESLQEVLDAYAARTGWKELKTECEEKNLAAAPMPDAAATTAAPAAEQEETLTTSESAEDASMYRASTSGATAAENLPDQPCHADAVLAIENPSNAATACSGAEKKPPQLVKSQPPLIQPEAMYVSPDGIRYKISIVTVGKKQYFRTECCTDDEWSAVNSSVYENLRDANGEFEAWIRTEKLVPEMLAQSDWNPCHDCRCKTCTSEYCCQAQCDGADKGMGCIEPNEDCPPAAPQAPEKSLASTTDTPDNPPTFDYAGLDKQTVTDLHLAEREYTAGKRLAEMGLRRMADGVAIAHEVLCGPVVPTWDNGNHEDGACPTLGRARNNQYSEDNFRRWCTSMGVSKSAAYRLLQVSTLFDQSSPNQQKVLAELAPSLLYAAAKPSAPAELVQAVKDGDITTHKQYRELLAQLKAKEQALAAKDNAMQQAQEKAEQYHVQVNELTESLSAAHQIRDNAQSRAAKAEAERDAAQQQAADQAARIQELEARPVEVVGASPDDIDKWRAEGRDMARKELQKELRQARKDAEKQRKRAETAEEDAEHSAQEAQDYATQLGQIRQELENADDVRKVRQTVEVCEQLLQPLILDITAMDSEQYTTAMNCLAALGDKLLWATQNDAWPTEDWPDLCYNDEEESDEWEDEEDE